MMSNVYSSNIHKNRSVVRMTLSTALMLHAVFSQAQESGDDLITLPMSGTETIDSKELISGDATVGINFLAETDDLVPNAIYVYFYEEPIGALHTELATVDGRYVYKAANTPPVGSTLIGRWGRLQLTNEEKKPLNTRFLKKNYSPGREIAIHVTDTGNQQYKKKSYPVRWGTKCATEKVRIRVNAEGADAYFISFEGAEKGKLVKCDEASNKSQFKFDHNCDMRWQDVARISQQGNIQIIRKRGATYEDPIPIRISAPEMKAEFSLQNCD